jgi:cysteinyl-tRNA synthetase
MFEGSHPLLTQAFSPMTIRFFILQSHYRSPVDFSSESLQASEKALKRLWDAYEILQKLPANQNAVAADPELDEKVAKMLDEFEEFMDDDFSTAKVLANMFEIVPVINSIKSGSISGQALSAATFSKLVQQFGIYLEEVFGLKNAETEKSNALDGVVQLLIELRKEAKAKKDYASSDKIRMQLQALGIALKDEKDGTVSWELI